MNNVAESRATINPPRGPGPRLLHTGHFHTRPGYATVRDHGAQDWLLFYTLAGSGRIAHLDGPLLSRPGDCVILPPGLPHDYRIAPSCEEWEFLWTHFIPWPHWMGLLSWPQTYRGIKYLHVSDQSGHERIRAALERMHSLRNSALQQRELFAMNALEEALLWLNSQNPDLDRSRFDSRVATAMDFICANIARAPTLAIIATACGLSAPRLSHLFRAQVGMAPVAYLEQQRMNRARELLEISALRVSEIAVMLGYESPFYFSRRFTKYTGQSPREYRGREASPERSDRRGT